MNVSKETTAKLRVERYEKRGIITLHIRNVSQHQVICSDICYRGDVVEDAGGLLPAAAVEGAEDHLHQVLSVSAALLGQPHNHPLQQELHCWIFYIQLVPLLTVLTYFFIQFDQCLRQAKFKEKVNCIKELKVKVNPFHYLIQMALPLLSRQ